MEEKRKEKNGKFKSQNVKRKDHLRHWRWFAPVRQVDNNSNAMETLW
jgi:hypothetical protein